MENQNKHTTKQVFVHLTTKGNKKLETWKQKTSHSYQFTKSTHTRAQMVQNMS
eukprot:m.373416 g.373416  ORF g.373416 m.373416 type:complete len:53 (+) comp68152_c0_seq1:39-197(+)